MQMGKEAGTAHKTYKVYYKSKVWVLRLGKWKRIVREQGEGQWMEKFQEETPGVRVLPLAKPTKEDSCWRQASMISHSTWEKVEDEEPDQVSRVITY